MNSRVSPFHCIDAVAPLTARVLLEPEITIVLSPIITAPRHEDRTSRFIGESLALLGTFLMA